VKSDFMQCWGRTARVTMTAVFMSAATLAFAQPTNLTVKHVQGETTIAANPEKTVVFDLASLDTLDALGIEATAVPETLLPDFLERYKQSSYPKVGTLFEPDYEAVHALSPDLIIVGGRSAPKQRDLSRIAPTIDLTVDPATLIDSVVSNTHTLASIYQKEDQADRLLKELDESIKALQQKAGKAGSGLVVLTVGGKMSAYGPGSRFGVIHDGFGVPPAVEGLATSNHGQAISFEFIYENNPDWLFVIDRDAAIGREGTPARKLLDNELMHKTAAWKKNHIVYLDSMNWYLLGGAGLTSLQQNVNEISKALDGKS